MRTMLIAISTILIGFSVAQASPWTLPRGEFYARGTALGSRSRWQFNNDSNRVKFLNNGLSRMVGTAVDGSFGLRDDLMVSIGVPVIFYGLRDDDIQEEGLSLGDIRISSRYRLFSKGLAVSLEAGVKFPSATQVDPARVQVGEGQYDFDGIVSFGFLWPSKEGYSSMDAGYRIRRRSEKTAFKPGNEFIYRFESGYQAGDRVSMRLSLDGFKSDMGNTEVFGVAVPTRFSNRNLLAVVPGITLAVKDKLGLDMNINIPVLGRNYYAGSQFFIGLSYNSVGARASLNQSTISAPQGGSCCRIQ